MEDRIYPGDALWGYVGLLQLLRNRLDDGTAPLTSSFALSGSLRDSHPGTREDGLASGWSGSPLAVSDSAARSQGAFGFSHQAVGMPALESGRETLTAVASLPALAGAAQELFGDVLPSAEALFNAGWEQPSLRARGQLSELGDGSGSVPGNPGEGAGFLPPGSPGAESDGRVLPGDVGMRGDDLFVAVNAGFGAVPGTRSAPATSPTSTPSATGNGRDQPPPGDVVYSEPDFTSVPCGPLKDGAGNWVNGWKWTEYGGDDSGAGRGSVTDVGLQQNSPQCDFEMRDGNSYLVSFERTFELRAPFIDFWYADLSFNHAAGITQTRDAFEAALLDSEGRPLTYTIAPGRDSFFNLSERSAAEGPLETRAQGVTHNRLSNPPSSQAGWVRVDVSNLYTPESRPTVKLVLRLINNDTDTGTSVRISGGHPDLVYRVPGNAGQSMQVTFKKTLADTDFGNELGFFIVENRTGAVRGQGMEGNLPPGDSLYFRRALEQARDNNRIVFDPYAPINTTRSFTLTAGTLIAVYLVQNGTTLQSLTCADPGALACQWHAFASFAAANRDSQFDHFQKWYGNDSSVKFGVEDLDNGGNQDFNDLMFTVTATLPGGQPGGGSSPGAGAGQGTAGVPSASGGLPPLEGTPIDKRTSVPLSTDKNSGPLLIPGGDPTGGPTGGKVSNQQSAGTDFWVTFPRTTCWFFFCAAPSGKLSLFITGEFPTTAQVSYRPEEGQPFRVESHAVSPGAMVEVPIPTRLMTIQPDGEEDKGVRVTAGAPVTVYGLINEPGGDAYLALPTAALGSDYVVASYPKNGMPFISAGSFMVVVGVNPSPTTVNIRAPHLGPPPGYIRDPSLEQGRTFQKLLDGEDITRTTATSPTGPFAVFAGSAASSFPCNDEYGAGCIGGGHLLEQLPPTSTWGKNFVTMPLATRASPLAYERGDSFRVVAGTNNTRVFINGNQVATLDRAQYYEASPNVTPLPNPISQPSVITADKPVLVLQYSHNSENRWATREDKHGTEFMMLVPPTEQFLNNYRLTTPGNNFDINYLSVFAPTAALGTIRLDGTVIPPDRFTPIQQSVYSGARVRVTPGPHHLTGDLPFGAQVYGYQSVLAVEDPRRGYGYPAGANAAPIADVTGISLSPASATRTIGIDTHHRLSAAVSPVRENVRVDFQVKPVGNPGHNVLGFAYTDANGVATFTYPGTIAGRDEILATVGPVTSCPVNPPCHTADWNLGDPVAPPTITVSSPANSSTFAPDTSVLVSGVARSGHARYPITHVTVNGAPVEVLDPAGNFFTRVTVAPGVNSYVFAATDTLGQTVTAPLSLRGTPPPPVDFGQLADVTASAQVRYQVTSLNEKTDVLYADLVVRNDGQYPFTTPLLVGVRNVRGTLPGQVSTAYPRETDGTLPDGTPYYDLSSLVTGGTLAPNALTSGTKSLAFFNPQRRQFRYDLVVLAGLNRPPRFTSVPRVEAIVGQAYSYQAVALDPDGHALTWDRDAASFAPPEGPAGMVISPTGLVTWAEPVAGRHSVKLRARDAFGGFAEQTFTLTAAAAPPNRPPLFTSLPVLTAQVGVSYTYQAAAIDPDLQSVTYTVGAPSPAGLTIPNPTTGVVTWTPTAAQSGPQTVTLIASDNAGVPATATQTFAVVVQPDPSNRPPVILSPATATTRGGAGVNFRFQVWAVDNDPGDTLTFSLPGAPPGVSINTTSGLMTWDDFPSQVYPAFERVYTVRVADSRGATDTQEFRLQVQSDIDGPGTISGIVFNDLNGNGLQDGKGEVGLAGRIVYLDRNRNHRLDRQADVPVEPTATSDASGNYTFAGVRPGEHRVAIEPAGWFQTAPLSGAHVVTLAPSVSIGGLAFGLVQTDPDLINQSPVFQGTAPTTGRVGELYLYAPVVHDPDRDPLVFSLPGRPHGMVVDTVSGTVGWRPTAAQVGTHTVTLLVRDGRGGEARRQYTITVTQANLPPVITTQPPAPARVGVVYTYLLHAVDPEGARNLSFGPTKGDEGTATSQDDDYSKLNDTNKYWETNLWRGAKVRIVDGQGTGQQGSITSNTPNQLTVSPAWTTRPNQTSKYEIFDFTPRPFLTCNAPNCPTLTVLPDNPSDPGRFVRLTWTPGDSHLNSTVFITVTATDPGGAVGRQVLSIPVIPEGNNHAPQFPATPGPRLNTPAGQLYTYRPQATDPDGDFLTYTPLLKPEGSTWDPDRGVLFWQPSLAQVGSQHPIQFRANDGRLNGITDDVARQILVGPPGSNQPPQIVSVPPRAGVAAREYVYEARAADPENDAVLWDLETAPTGMQIDRHAGTVRWLPAAAQIGPHDVAVRATDALGGRAVQRYTLTVRPANQAPQITSTPPTRADAVDVYVYAVRAVDPEGDRLTFSLLTAPRGMTVEPHTGLIRWSAPTTTGSPHTIVVQAEDGLGGVAQQTYRLEVVATPPNRPPTIISAPVTQGRVTMPVSPYQYQVQARDPDVNPTLTYSLTSVPGSGLGISPTGLVSWATPVTGEYAVTVTVDDTVGGVAQQRWTLTVKANVAPIIDSTAPATPVTKGLVYRYDVRARDGDIPADPLTYGLSVAPAGMTIDGFGRILWPTAGVAVNTYNATVRVTDDFGGEALQPFTVTVAADGEAPRVSVHVSLPGNPIGLPNLGDSGRSTQPNAQRKLKDTTKQWPVNQWQGRVVEITYGLGAGQRLTITENTADELTVNADWVPIPDNTSGYTIQPRPGLPNFGDSGRSTQPNVQRKLKDATKQWQPNQWQGRVVEITYGLGVGQRRTITENAADELTVSADWAPIPDNTSEYTIEQNLVDPNQAVTVVVMAQDNVGVTGLGLTVDGLEVPLDARGQAVVRQPYRAAPYAIVGRATDAANNTGTGPSVLTIRDPGADVTLLEMTNPPPPPPPPSSEAPVTAPLMVRGRVQWTGASGTWQFRVIPVDGGPGRLINSGSTQGPGEQDFGLFDPSGLENGTYILRLTATSGGSSRTVERTVGVAGGLKLGNFRVSFTDLTVPVAGIPITIGRTYDTLRANQRDDLGFGWRLDIGDADLKFHFPEGPQQGFGRFPSFRYGDRVVLTRPGGEPESFTFEPIAQQIFPGVYRYRPFFRPDPDVTSFLLVQDAVLERREDFGGMFISLEPEGIVSYNPAERAFGGTYTLIGLDGVRHVLSAETGKLQKLTDRNRNELTIAANSISSNRGNLRVDLQRDGQGRITKITDPRGVAGEAGNHFVEYVYNAAGDLSEVKDRLGQSTFYAYGASKPHYLDRATDSLGQVPVRTTYRPGDGRLGTVRDAAENEVVLNYTVNTTTRQQTLTDPRLKVTTVDYDSFGNVASVRDPLNGETRTDYVAGTRFVSKVTQVYPGDPSKDLVTEYLDVSTTTGLPGRVKDPEGKISSFTYDRYGQVTSETDPLGNTTTYDYDPATGNLRGVTPPDTATSFYEYDPNGNVKKTIVGSAASEFFYNDYGRLVKTKSPTGVVRETEPDANGNLKREWTTWTNPDNPAHTRTLTTTHEYDSNDRRFRTTDPEGKQTLYEYDALNRVKKVTNIHGLVTETRYEARGLVVERRTLLNEQLRSVSRTLYDAFGRPEYVTDEFVPGGLNDPPNGTRNWYDDAGRLWKVERVAALRIAVQLVTPDVYQATLTSAGAVYSTTQTVYNPLSQVERTIDAANQSTLYEYNKRGQTTKVTNALTQQVVTTYDDAGRAVFVTNWHLPPTPPPVPRTQTEYDGSGRPKKVIYADTTFTQTAYDDFGRRTAQTDEMNRTTNFEYDGFGRLTAVVQPEVTDPEALPATSVRPRTEYTYDVYGKLKVQRDAKGRETTFAHDEYQRQVRRALPGSLEEGRASGTSGANTLQDLAKQWPAGAWVNRAVRIVSGPGANQDRRITSHDANTLTVDTNWTTPPTTASRYVITEGRATSGAAGTLTDTFKAWAAEQWKGWVVRIVAGTGTGQEREVQSNTTTVLTVTANWNTNPDATSVYALAPVEKTAYNAFGQLWTKLDFKGQKTEFVYEAGLNRVQFKKLYPAGSPTPTEQVEYRYDALGRTDQVIQPLGTTDYDYNADSRLTRVTTAQGVIEYAYDPATGRRTRTWTANTSLHACYDELGRLKEVRPVAGPTTNCAQAEPAATVYTYTVAGALEKVQRPTSPTTLWTVYGQDARQRVTSVRHCTSAACSTEVRGYTYTRRPDGRIATVQERDNGANARALEYTYDALGRLTQEKHTPEGGGPETTDYVLDLVGNRLSKTTAQGTTSWRYDPRDRIVDEVFGGAPARRTLYGWDLNGALTSKTLDYGTGETGSYSYNLEGRLSGATVARSGNTYVAAYRYNDAGLRVREEVSTNGGPVEVKHLVVDGNNPTGYAQVLEERDGASALLASYVYGLEPLSQTRAGTVSHYLLDAHSGVRALASTAGAVTDTFRYDAFGGQADRTGTTVNVVQYRGERFDAALSQYYLRARTYDPATGRLPTLDPFRGQVLSPLTLHRYLYAHADPVNGEDPTGLETLTVSLGKLSIGHFIMGAMVLWAVQPVLQNAWETLFAATAVASAAPWRDAVEGIIREVGLLTAPAAQEFAQPLLERIAKEIATATAVLPCPEGGEIFEDPTTGYPRLGVYVVGPFSAYDRRPHHWRGPTWFNQLNRTAPPPDGAWEKGHLIGRQLGGPSKPYNLIPQSRAANLDQERDENEIGALGRGGACLVVCALAMYGHASPWQRVPSSTQLGYVDLVGFGKPLEPRARIFPPIPNP